MKFYITQLGHKLLEAKKRRGRRRSDTEEAEGRGDRDSVDDEALEGKFTQERLKFLKSKN